MCWLFRGHGPRTNKRRCIGGKAVSLEGSRISGQILGDGPKHGPLWFLCPFPSCPRCSRSWGALLPWGLPSRTGASCRPLCPPGPMPGLRHQWTEASQFICLSVTFFDAARSNFCAVPTAELLRQQMMEQDSVDGRWGEAHQQRRQESFTQWAYDIAYQLGHAAGALVGKIERWFG